MGGVIFRSVFHEQVSPGSNTTDEDRSPPEPPPKGQISSPSYRLRLDRLHKIKYLLPRLSLGGNSLGGNKRAPRVGDTLSFWRPCQYPGEPLGPPSAALPASLLHSLSGVTSNRRRWKNEKWPHLASARLWFRQKPSKQGQKAKAPSRCSCLRPF